MISQSKRKVAFFTSLCLFCSMVEMVIPKPGFLRIGISNVPVMLALYSGFSISEFVCLVLLRIVYQALLNGTLLSYAFILSASAGITSALIMIAVFRIPGISYIGFSELCAFGSNLVQIYVSHFFLGKGVYSLAPITLGVGIVSSFLLGWLTSFFCRNSEFLKDVADISFFAEFVPEYHNPMNRKFKAVRLLKISICAVLLMICFFSDGYLIPFSVCMVFLLACLVTRRKIRFWPVFWMCIRTVLIAMLLPSGRVLWSLGNFHITYNSIFIGLRRSFILLSSCWFSRFIIPERGEIETAFKSEGMAYMVLCYFKEITQQWFRVDKSLGLVKRIDMTLVAALQNNSNITE